MKKTVFVKKALSLVLVLVMLTTVVPFGMISVSASSTFKQQNILQVNAASSSDYISGDWHAFNDDISTIAKAGCGIISLVSAIYNLGGTIEKNNLKNVIKEVFDWACSKKYWNGNDGTFWTLFAASDEKFGSTYGFDVLETGANYGCYGGPGKQPSLDALIEHIKNGNGTAILHVHNHYIVVVDYKKENEKEYLYVFDPAPGKYSYNRKTSAGKEITHAKGTWLSIDDLKNDGGKKGGEYDKKGNYISYGYENIETDGYWLIAPTGSTPPTTTTDTTKNPDKYTFPTRDIYEKSPTMTGNDVAWIQAFLCHIGYTVSVDKSYGPETKAAVIKFQKKYGLSADGSVGPKTRPKMEEVWKATGHTWDSGKVTTEATHLKEGVKTYTCTVSGCGATKTEPISVKAHTWNSGTVTKPATHTEIGTKTYKCTGCETTKTESIPAISDAHSFGAWQKVDDNLHRRVCTCGMVETSFHDWNSGEITKPATYTDEGIKTYTCTICSATKEESIPCPTPPTEENKPTITVSSCEAAAGETVTVYISIKNNPGIASLILNVAYDSDLLTLTGIEYSNKIGGQTIDPADFNSPVTLYWINAFENMSDDLTFATLTFKVDENAVPGDSSGISVTYNANDIYNIAEENIEFSAENGTVSVSDYLPGDINGDGTLNNKDVTRLMQYFANWDVDVNEAAIDVNGDGAQNNKDVSRLMQYIAGWDVVIH